MRPQELLEAMGQLVDLATAGMQGLLQLNDDLLQKGCVVGKLFGCDVHVIYIDV
jgi:hypothetical protein